MLSSPPLKFTTTTDRMEWGPRYWANALWMIIYNLINTGLYAYFARPIPRHLTTSALFFFFFLVPSISSCVFLGMGAVGFNSTFGWSRLQFNCTKIEASYVNFNVNPTVLIRYWTEFDVMYIRPFRFLSFIECIL